MAKIQSKKLVFSIGTPLAVIPIFDPKLSEVADEHDVTDSASGDSKEYLEGYIDRSITFSQWFRDDVDTPPAIGDSVAYEWKIGTAKKITGTLVITGRELGAPRENAHRWDFTARVNSATLGDVAA